MLESLEARRLLSVTLEDGVLTVTGTEMNDLLFVGRHHNLPRIVVSDNGVVSVFNPMLVDSIVINGLEGNDRIGIGPGLFKPITVDGGAGDDAIRGGTGPETLMGGIGNDLILGGGGGDLIEGGDGNDLLVGGRGADTMLGGDGNDRFHSVDGTVDFIDGGDGEDAARVDADDVVQNVEHVFVRPTPPPVRESRGEGDRAVESEKDTEPMLD